MTRIGRRRFLGVAGLGLLGAACGGRVGDRELVGDADLDAAPDGTEDLGLADSVPDVNPSELSDPLDTLDSAPDVNLDSRPDGDDSAPGFTLEALPELSAVFPFGVQAGDAHAHGARLWTRFVGAEATRLVVVAGHEGPGEVVADREVRRTVDAAGAYGVMTAEVDALAPGRPYRYAFVTASGRSPIGRFRTAPEAGARPVVRFTASSCTNAWYRPYDTLAAAAARAPDFHVLLGDTAYCDGAISLDEYREVWATSLTDRGYRALLSATSAYATWDDHEVTNDWDPETTPASLVATATAALREHLPLREPPREDPAALRLWRSARWGDTCELIVLDCRSERLPSTRHTPAAQYLSPAQLAWLERTLVESPCRYKVVVSSVPVTDMPDYFQQVRDRWTNYEAQRARVLDLIAGRAPAGYPGAPPAAPIRGVIWLAGDYHFGALARIDRAGGPDADRFEVITSPAGNAPNSAWPRTQTDDPAQFPFATGEANFAELTLDPEHDQVWVAWVDARGVELHRQLLPVD